MEDFRFHIWKNTNTVETVRIYQLSTSWMDKIETPDAQIHNQLLLGFGTITSMKRCQG